ncbi:SDR family NAD(P)-dependent oxidoreductase [Ruegeria sp. 2012CJ41-6]|uniref:SDR family NAD(P)-dependent oxidoreductase n=1 Tax=Ruegeria spongiae TaxID=2942209 RepID=A0ABT0Q8P6_9RHOB|nr:SDR family NAD(P)-dependent oxidoreductase [Ruegeria spongiae]MCL6286185.1 SDR family NAD(P)-dependent oxidoreductase [Ruegeria spongiae]
MDIDGKTAIVTGAGSGIGRGLAISLAKSGMNVVLVGHHQPPLDDTAAAILAMGGKSVTVTADVSKLDDVQRVANEAIRAFGAVHLLCNNAGIGPFASTAETTIAEWEWVLSVNLWGVIHGIHVFLPIFEAQGEGHINATASESGLYGTPYLAAYNTSKFAVIGLMQSLARDLRATQSDVTASVLCPGAVKTHILDSARERPDTAQRPVEVSAETHAFRDLVNDAVANGMPPEDVAACVVDGIRKGQFWIFSHDHVPETAFKQSEAMLYERRLIDL